MTDKISELLAMPGANLKIEVTRDDMVAFADTIASNIMRTTKEQIKEMLILANLMQPQNESAIQDLTREQIRQIVNNNYTNQTFRNWEARGLLVPAYRIGRNPMYKREDVKKMFRIENL